MTYRLVPVRAWKEIKLPGLRADFEPKRGRRLKKTGASPLRDVRIFFMSLTKLQAKRRRKIGNFISFQALIARILLVATVIQAAQAWVPSLCLSNETPNKNADETSEETVPAEIPAGPSKPTAPQALKQPVVIDAFHCERRFLYMGKVFGCDSNVQRDAERLRPLMADVPQALAELDTYQRNRQSVRIAAYAGSIGIIAAIGGVLIARTFTDSNGNATNTGIALRNYALAGGLGLTGISLIYGLSILSTNESHIDNAVRYHNQAHPGTPIELQFTTGFSF